MVVGRRCGYRCNERLYHDYYLNQAGNGLPVYVGGGSLRGSGLGSVLGGLFRAAMPVLKRGGKALLKEGARAGLEMAGDVLSGASLKTAAKNRSKQVGERLLNRAVNQISHSSPVRPPGIPASKRIKLSTRSRGGQTRSRVKGGRKKPTDIFT